MNDRGHYWLQASSDIRAANKLTMGEPDWWAHMLSALVNSNMASASDTAMCEVEFLTLDRKAVQKGVQKAIKDGLK